MVNLLLVFNSHKSFDSDLLLFGGEVYFLVFINKSGLGLSAGESGVFIRG